MLVPQDEELESLPKTEPIKQDNPKLSIDSPSGTLFSKPAGVNTRPVTSKTYRSINCFTLSTIQNSTKASSGISSQIFSTPSQQSTKLKEEPKIKEDLKPKEDSKNIVDNLSKLLSKYDPGNDFHMHRLANPFQKTKLN